MYADRALSSRTSVSVDYVVISCSFDPLSNFEETLRSPIIDSCIRLVDNGRETHHRKDVDMLKILRVKYCSAIIMTELNEVRKEVVRRARENASIELEVLKQG